ncbi:MAG: hypothetical protein HYV09_35875 [Deltaproteobacteria bacterium]|nr:hypothetical protein [Deltaproteobacteria bacterium]
MTKDPVLEARAQWMQRLAAMVDDPDFIERGLTLIEEARAENVDSYTIAWMEGAVQSLAYAFALRARVDEAEELADLSEKIETTGGFRGPRREA